MKIFCDLHHGDLYRSLQILFEDRLGFEMYKQIGLEWYREKYWNVYNHPATAKQYLDTNTASNAPTDIHGKVLPKHYWGNTKYFIEDGIYYVTNRRHNVIQRAITLDKFKQIDFDIIIASIPQHIKPFKKLIKLYQPKAKLIFQIGNPWWDKHQAEVDNILASVKKFPVQPGKNVVFYYQEFDLNIYKYKPPTTTTVVNSYVHYMKNQELMNLYASMLPTHQFTKYGASFPNNLGTPGDIAKAMQDSAWTWHFKPRGDGFGHILHSSYACGRPAIIHGKPYKDKLAGDLLINQKTCIDYSLHTVQQNVELIRKYSDPELHLKMCEAARDRFYTLVNYDEEEQKVRTFLSNLK